MDRPFFYKVGGMRKNIIMIPVLIGILLMPNAGFSEEELGKNIDTPTKEVCNKVMLNIYHDLIASKDKYRELEQFDEKALYENQYGIYAIVYKYEKQGEQGRNYLFEFGLTIVGIDDPIFQDQGEYAFNLVFPLLNVKFAGYQKRSVTRYRYDISSAIKSQGVLLEDHQQNYMPLRLILKADKEIFTTNENVFFDVELHNVSNRHMRVKSLNDSTLYCLFGDKRWGTSQVSVPKAEEFILKSGELTKMGFMGEAFKKPREMEIYCSYNLSIQGVKPSDTLKVKIVEPPMSQSELK